MWLVRCVMTNTHIWSYLAQFFQESENELVRKNIVQSVGQATDDNTIRRMRFACRIPNPRKMHKLVVVYFPGITTHCGCIFTARYRDLASSFSRFLNHTQRSATVGRTLLDEWSIRRRDLYLTTHNIHYRQTSKLWVGFEPTISAGVRPKTYALDRAATGTGYI